VISYSVAGFVSAAFVGYALGYLSWPLRSAVSFSVRACALLIVLILLTARELDILAFEHPTRQRTSAGQWCQEFGYISAATMWGFDIGLGFTTWIAFGGFWLLVCAIVTFGNGYFGALTMSAYWLGRILSTWLAPTMVCGATQEAIKSILADGTFHRRLHTVGLLLVAFILAERLWKGGAW